MADVLLVSDQADAALFVDDAPVGLTPLVAPVRISAAALGLASVGTALSTNSDQRAYDRELTRTTTRGELDALAERTEQKALVTDILLGATLVTGTITLILLLTDDGDESQPTLQVGAGSLRTTF